MSNELIEKSLIQGGLDTFIKSSFKVWHMKRVHKLTCIFTDFVNIYGHKISDRHKPQSFPTPQKIFLSGIIPNDYKIYLTCNTEKKSSFILRNLCMKNRKFLVFFFLFDVC